MQATANTDVPFEPPPTVGGELRAMVHLAIPLAATHLGQMLLGAVDTAVVGRLGDAELGATGLGNSVFFTLQVFGIGVVLGLDPLISQAVGAREMDRARRLFRQGVWIAFLLGVPLIVLQLGLTLSLGWFGIQPGTVELTWDYIVSRAPGVIPFLVFAVGRSYLQSLSRIRILVVAVVVANVVNLPLSWLLVFGDSGLERFGLPGLGVPALGVAGAGWTSTVCTLIQMAFILVAVRSMPSADSDAGHRPDRGLLTRALGLGLPIGFALLAEVGIFSAVNVAMGNFSTEALAGHQVALTLAALTFMVPIGVGAATSVRVGYAVGRGDVRATRMAGAVGLGAGLAFMALGAILFLTVPEHLSAIITDKPEVIAAAVPLVFVAAVFQLSDGAQAVAAGALRGAGDTRFVLVANLVGHYCVGLPVALGLGFRTALGPSGLWWGLSAGLTVVAVALTFRFFRLAARPIART